MKNDDIEAYLAQLQDGWLSEDDLEKDSDGEEYHDVGEIIKLLEENTDSEEGDEDAAYSNTTAVEDFDSDPPLVNDVSEPIKEQNTFRRASSGYFTLDKRKLLWKKKNMDYSVDKIAFEGSSNTTKEISQLETPFQCFTHFFTPNFMQKIVDQTNLYVLQKNPNSNAVYTSTDLKNFFGILLYMSVQRFPSTRSYWSPIFGYPPISSVMPVNKFEKMKLAIHFNNNDEYKPVGHLNHDRLFKIRPVIEHLNETFATMPLNQRLSIDEQMCATKMGHFLKQYLPNKPHKWGFKLYVLCNLLGYAHKFEIYSGQENTRLDGEPDLGATGNVVVRLIRGVPRMQNHIIYFDNFYTSLPLVHYMAKQGIHTVGTVQQNRIPNSKLPDKKTFMKKSVPRGSFEERVATFDDIDLTCVAWKDNKMVTLLSSYAGALPLTKISRYDKAKKEKIEITCPFIVQEYNEHMGGVDLMDSFLGRNHITIRTKKWYLRIFFHLLDMAVINSWVVYNENARKSDYIKKMSMSQFRNELALVLCNKGINKEVKRGRPSCSVLEQQLETKRRRGSPAPPPPKEIRKDGIEHWPTVGISLRCKYPSCKGYTTVSCNKCRVNLCLNKNNNCFLKYHKE